MNQNAWHRGKSGRENAVRGHDELVLDGVRTLCTMPQQDDSVLYPRGIESWVFDELKAVDDWNTRGPDQRNGIVPLGNNQSL
jgi:hypothetical protein